MTNITCDNEILVTMSHTREIAINDVLQVNLKMPRNIGNIQVVKVIFNRQNENPCIIKEMHKTKEEDDFIEFE